MLIVASGHPNGRFPPKFTQRAIPVEVHAILTNPTIGLLGKTALGSLDPLPFDARTLCSLDPLAVDALQTLCALDALALSAVRTLGALNALPLTPVRTLGALNALALNPVQTLGALNALALDPLRPLGTLNSLALDPRRPLGALNSLTFNALRAFGTLDALAFGTLWTFSPLGAFGALWTLRLSLIRLARFRATITVLLAALAGRGRCQRHRCNTGNQENLASHYYLLACKNLSDIQPAKIGVVPVPQVNLTAYRIGWPLPEGS
ncbi:MAG: hypothetical protein M3Q19_06900 [Pseudomonadota bacterium]|nr:hypothetical protein [Pseudomonadota bacterium]